MTLPTDVIERITRRTPLIAGHCLLWTGTISAPNLQGHGAGYGVISYTDPETGVGRRVRVHRLVWEHIAGPIPDGWTIDHVCHNFAAERGECVGGNDCLHRRCYNINHLRSVPHGMNKRAALMDGLSALDASIPNTRPQPVDTETAQAVLQVFDSLGAVVLPSQVLVDQLPAIRSKKALAVLLQGVRRAENIWWDGKRVRGYRRADVAAQVIEASMSPVSESA